MEIAVAEVCLCPGLYGGVGVVCRLSFLLFILEDIHSAVTTESLRGAQRGYIPLPP